MTEEEVERLQEGDQVYWNDPDEGACSRTYNISSIGMVGQLVSIVDEDGSTLECYPEELQ